MSKPPQRIVAVVVLVVAGIALQLHDLPHLGEGQVEGALPQLLHELPCLVGAAGVGVQTCK